MKAKSSERPCQWLQSWDFESYSIESPLHAGVGGGGINDAYNAIMTITMPATYIE